MKNLLFDLCRQKGVSGYEDNIADYCVEYLSRYAPAEKDFNNNVIAVMGSGCPQKTILLDAHIDQIGLIVTDIDENGFVKADKCGGADLRVLPGSPVTIHGKRDINGIICCMPPHLSDGKEGEAVAADNLWIDAGLPPEEAGDVVSIGNAVSLYGEPRMLIGTRVASPSLDNRAGVAVLLKTVEYISKSELNARVIVLLSCQEETYASGAKTKAYEYNPDECICVDVSFASQPGVDNQYAEIALGEGPMVCLSPVLDRGMAKDLIAAADKYNIPYQLEVCPGRTGTNADCIAVAKKGVKSAVVSVPQRNMHTAAEIVDLKDLEYTAQLIAHYITRGGVSNE